MTYQDLLANLIASKVTLIRSMPRLFLNQPGPQTTMLEILTRLDPAGDRFEWLVTDVSDAQVLGEQDDTTRAACAWVMESEFSAPTFELVRVYSQVHIQYAWAVFSAFRLAEAPDPNFLPVYPTANGNPHLWEEDPQPQHPKALFEIVAWDNSETLAICRNDHWSEFIKRTFPEASTKEKADES